MIPTSKSKSTLRVLYCKDPDWSSREQSDLPIGTATSPPLIISERQCRRYEVDPVHIDTLTFHDLSLIGKGKCGERVEVLELADHP